MPIQRLVLLLLIVIGAAAITVAIAALAFGTAAMPGWVSLVAVCAALGLAIILRRSGARK